MIIIDQVNKTIERYEPQGHHMAQDKNKKMLKGIDNKFNTKLLNYLGLKNYTYISPIDISPKLGLQLKADAYYGMCLSYSMLYLQLRIMNPDVDQADIIKYLIKKPRDEIYDIILRYTKYIEDKLKEHSQEIIDYNNIFYNQSAYKIKKFILVNKRSEIDEIEY